MEVGRDMKMEKDMEMGRDVEVNAGRTWGGHGDGHGTGRKQGRTRQDGEGARVGMWGQGMGGRRPCAGAELPHSPAQDPTPQGGHTEPPPPPLHTDPRREQFDF